MKTTKNKKIFWTLIILSVCLTLFMLLFFRIDSDYFWHIKAGEEMFKTGILKEDIFSWIVNGKYWMSHEWGFEIIIYSLKVLFGNYHVFIYSFLCLLGLLLFLFITNKNNYMKNIPFTLLWYLLFFLLMINYLQARPHLLSFIFLASTIYVLYDLYKNQDSKKIYLLPLITIIWSNVHGGSSNLPYLFCLLFIVGGIFSFNKSKIEAKRISKKQFSKYFVVMLLCMGAVLINAHGVKMFIYPYLNMMDSTMINNISEWQNTSLNYIQHYLYFILLLVVIFTMLFSKKKIEFIDLLLLGVGTYLGLKSIRFWIFTYIIMSYVIFNYVSFRQFDKGTKEVILIFSVLLFGLFLSNSKHFLNIKYCDILNKELVSIIKKERPERLFNMYDYGGELIYNDIPVFIDGRADLYSKYNYKDYLKISELDGDYVKLIDKYNFDYFLVSKKYPINTYLKYNDSYEVIYKNKYLLLYKKDKS